MTESAPTADGGLPPERLAEVVRRGLGLSSSVPVEIEEKGEFSNINYVYRATVPGRSLYLKVVPERPKRFPIQMPRERVFSEAEGLRRFRALAGEAIEIPAVLFVDEQEMTLGMSDVGHGRQVLYSLLPDGFALLAEQAEALGRALGSVHGGTRGSGPFRPPREEVMVRRVIFDGLLAPGAKLAFPELWDSVRAEMEGHDQCLVHADLWSKNLLVEQGYPVALVDFEGVHYCDPAFDLGTLFAVALVPALARPGLVDDALSFIASLTGAWAAACGDPAWRREVEPRAFRATATFLAARGFGPFAYSLDEAARERIGELARSLAESPPADQGELRARVTQVVSAAESPAG